MLNELIYTMRARYLFFRRPFHEKKKKKSHEKLLCFEAVGPPLYILPNDKSQSQQVLNDGAIIVY